MRTNHRLLRHTAVSLVLAVSVVPMATFGENDIESRARPRLQDQLTEFSGGCPPFPSDHGDHKNVWGLQSRSHGSR